MKNKISFFVIISVLSMAKLNAVVWYQMNFNDFNSGEKNYTAIRSTDTAAYIELGRTGAGEFSADANTVGLWHFDEKDGY